MASQKQTRGSGMAGKTKSRSKKGNAGTQRKQPIGSVPVPGAEYFVSWHYDAYADQTGTDADQDGASRQTGTAQDELGQM